MSKNLAITAVVYTIAIICQIQRLPWFTLSLAITLLFSRWAFDIHDRTHAKGKYPLLEELMLLIMSPLSVGLNEQRRIHARHHAKLGAPADPDYVFYSQGVIASFILCLFHPEITFARSLPTMPLMAKVRAGLRCYLFVALWAIGGSNFLLWYLLPLRLIFGLAQWMFTFCLHHRADERTIDLVLPRWFMPLIGTVGMKELSSHKRHHSQFSTNRPHAF